MARTKRLLSNSGIYHIMLRGNNKQSIFVSDDDYSKYLFILQDAKDKFGFELFAYCIMKNHLHLLLRPKEENFENIFKYIGARFVYWYNLNHSHSGHLFQGRFKSIPVENDEYFLTLLRYIHQNPVNAGICSNVRDYPYSSYKYYAEKPGLADTDFAEGILDKEHLLEFINTPTTEEIEIFPKIRLSDSQASRIIGEHIKEDAHQLSDQQLYEKVKILIEKGLSVRQIARLTTISYAKIRKFL